jgi:protein glucosyltransferase
LYQENDDIAQRVANAGHQWVVDHLRMQDVANYWYAILREYASLAKWKPTKSPDTKPPSQWKDW